MDDLKERIYLLALDIIKDKKTKFICDALTKSCNEYVGVKIELSPEELEELFSEFFNLYDNRYWYQLEDNSMLFMCLDRIHGRWWSSELIMYSEEDDISYQELYGRVLEKSPIIITVSRESVPDIKRGITNAKHAARKKALYHGLPWDSAILRFETQETENEKERKFYIDLKISAERKAFFSKKE